MDRPFPKRVVIAVCERSDVACLAECQAAYQRQGKDVDAPGISNLTCMSDALEFPSISSVADYIFVCHTYTMPSGDQDLTGENTWFFSPAKIPGSAENPY
jgi:hypothetical protein